MWNVYKFTHFTLFWITRQNSLHSHFTQNIILLCYIHFSKYCSIPILFTFFITPTPNHFSHTLCQRDILVLLSHNSKLGSTEDIFEEMPYALCATQEGCVLRTSKYYKSPQNYKWNPATQLGSSKLLTHHCNNLPLPIQHYENPISFT